MKTATMIEEHPSDAERYIVSKLYSLSEPMAFRELGGMSPGVPDSDERYIMTTEVVVCEVASLIPRVVIHAARRLKGESGHSYGGFGEGRVVDGICDGKQALALQGYDTNLSPAEIRQAPPGCAPAVIIA